MRLLNWIKRKLHRHSHNKIVVSRYAGFNHRDVIVECKCGHRMVMYGYWHDWVYPHQTGSFDSKKEFLAYLNQSPTKDNVYYKLHYLNL